MPERDHAFSSQMGRVHFRVKILFLVYNNFENAEEVYIENQLVWADTIGWNSILEITLDSKYLIFNPNHEMDLFEMQVIATMSP